MKSKQKSILKSLYAAIIQSRISFFLFFLLLFLFALLRRCGPQKMRSFTASPGVVCVCLSEALKRTNKN